MKIYRYVKVDELHGYEPGSLLPIESLRYSHRLVSTEAKSERILNEQKKSQLSANQQGYLSSSKSLPYISVLGTNFSNFTHTKCTYAKYYTYAQLCECK